MKILYITVPSFFDLEISLIRELSKLCEVKVIMFVTPSSMKSSAFSIDTIHSSCGLIDAKDYNGLEQYSNMINLENWHIANNPTNSIINSIKLSIQIKKYIKKYSPDLVHYTNFGFNQIGSILSFSNKYKRLLTMHDPIPHKKDKFYNELFLKWTIRICRNVLFLSNPPAQITKQLHQKGCTLYQSSLGPYDFLCNYIEEHEGNIADKYILFFGRIEYYKGVDILIKSFLSSRASKNGYKLIIAGKGNLQDEVGIPDQTIIFQNRYIGNDELANLIKNAEIVVLPYRSATQSGVIMSAFALGTPVIVTDVGNMKDVAGNGKYGLIVTPNNVKNLADAIDELLLDNPQELNEIRLNIKQNYNIEGKFGWASIAKNLVDIYTEITR